jgi:cytochrome c-type biogenesis protein CcmH/NrfG
MPLELLADSHRNVFERAIIEFRRAQEMSLDHAGGHLALGSLDRHHGRTALAVEHFRTAIQLEPYMSGPRGELATLLQDQGGNDSEIRQLREEEAELLERDARLAPENAEISYQLGLLRYLLGEFDAAQTALAAACSRSPQNYEFLMALALLLERRYDLTDNKQHFDEAVATLTKMHELRPADPRTRQILSRMVATRQSRQRE